VSITDPDSVYGPGAGHRDETGIGGNPYPYGECTYYCWQYYKDTQQVSINGQLGNATQWVDSAHRERWAVDDQPLPAKTVCWSDAKYPPFGHVAVVSRVNGDGTFDVLEMNFTYFAAERPELAGKIDQRTVRDRDGIKGFITPTGVTAANGGPGNDLLGALAPSLTSIGDAIRQAALFFEAEAMTAQLRLLSMGEVALGTGLAGGGAALAGFTLAGGGSPSRGLARARRRVQRGRRQLVSPRPSPVGRRALRPAEEKWVPRRTLEEAIAERARGKLAAGVDPRLLTDREAAWLQQHPDVVAETLKGRRA
jgi:surface antigen